MTDGTYDILVVGGGHAGVEAAAATGRMGARTGLITMQAEAMARMSCNPAIGGLGKGHIVREIDALGGLMGLIADATGIQFRTLNQTKGPAVQAPRAQSDREDYSREALRQIQNVPNVEIIEGIAEDVLTRQEDGHSQVTGITLQDGRKFAARAVIITAGTFLRGLMHCGEVRTEGGRIGEPAAVGLSESLERLGLTLERLKTGTPPRIHKDSLDYDQLQSQPGDDPPRPFSYMNDRIDTEQVCCWITWTNPHVHDIIRSNLDRAPLFSGQIQSTGPRYCPSIEDKVVRFADKERHQLFLEPEGRNDERIYCNGISTSLPRDVQEQIVHSIPGLENARILQYGYAIEYDFVSTHQIRSTLETKAVRGLYLAGQINGTSGYEEAGGLGLVAGTNAVQQLRGGDPFIPGREESYIGVMIDDLITKPPIEPYRMFTSRAEYRLHLRADNADVRLTPKGRELGLVSDDRWERFQADSQTREAVRKAIDGIRKDGVPLAEWLKRPEASLDVLRVALEEGGHTSFPAAAIERVLIEIRYAGYLTRQAREIEKFKRMESMTIPDNLDYQNVTGLRREAKERFQETRPLTLGQASRISGIHPADITTLWIHLTAKKQ